MSDMDDATERELDLMEPYARLAFSAHAHGTDGPTYDDLTTLEKLAYCAAADAVLSEYDPEWPSRKAGM